MELELRVKGDSEELERVIRLIRNTEGQIAIVSHDVLDVQAKEFVAGLGNTPRKILEVLVTSSIDGKGVDENDLISMLGGKSHDAYGAMGGLGRRWSSIAGENHGSPFRKTRTGPETGHYLLPDILANAFADALGVSRD